MRFVRVLRTAIPTKRLAATAFLSAILLGAAQEGSASAQDNGVPNAWIDFDIPAQPLAGALNAYGAATHIQLFVDSSLTSGRRSTALRGAFTPEAGLLSLIAGTGLIARPIGDEGVTLVPLDKAQIDAEAGGGPSSSSPLPMAALRFAGYSTRLQRALIKALCQRGGTARPGNYRTLIRLWIDSSGSVARMALLMSTGDRARDVTLSDALSSLATGEPPPPGLPQPITLLLAPGAKPAEDYCPPKSPPLRRTAVTP